ncbi:MAG: hypothetical protein P1V51_02475 [Deltaproteobacteria bacterium]|nr:hypothetical protein [Deltaproteobacteria bacterium]
MSEKGPGQGGELGVTALYTAGVWEWAGFPGAGRLAGEDTRAVFRWVNRFLALSRLFRPGLPSLRHSLARRHAIIDHLAAREPGTLLLEIGVGLSPRTLAAAAEGRRCVEVDLPEVMRLRQERLALGEGGPLPRAVGGDLRDEAAIGALLTEPATVVVEGVFPYFDTQEREAIWRGLARALAARGGRLIFDLTPAGEQPRPGLLGRLLGFLMRRFTRGRDFVPGHPDREAIEAALRAAGFASVACFDQDHPPEGCVLPGASLPTQTVVFEAGTEVR